ncbi:uncharacterized protein ATNIH1004_011213 [Aspergillus tanneri]|uniref:Major facilitator superfamily (MFS) profile domain-containing protein n=1 Tax=Aspergillus tanneri TaxID=1220188 RepID=A0A5M9M5F8_9EURO|nr:uncharacterized protein ATNIH1004_011213 [Aspergillus tanneri]KAA8642272.1 hypothetical protein ATNIH1004_011213 [Aspergillus tanneri]
MASTQGLAFVGAEYYLPLYFQSAKEAAPFHSGLMVGTAVVLLGTGLFIDFGAASSLGKIIVYQIVTGMGCGLLFFPPLLALQSNVPQDQTAAATATFGFIRNMAMAMSVVLGGVVFQNGMGQQQSSLLVSGLPS